MTPQSIESSPHSAFVARDVVADDLNREQLAARTTTITPELKALLTNLSHGDSGLND